MTEQLKLFIKEVQSNDELKAKLEELEKIALEKHPDQVPEAMAESLIALAKEHGYELNKEDFEASAIEISDEELDEVAGGRKHKIKRFNLLDHVSPDAKRNPN